MKKILVLVIAISLFAVLSKVIATPNDYAEIAKSDKVGVTIYAKKLNGLYTDFKVISFQNLIGQTQQVLLGLLKLSMRISVKMERKS